MSDKFEEFPYYVTPRVASALVGRGRGRSIAALRNGKEDSELALFLRNFPAERGEFVLGDQSEKPRRCDALRGQEPCVEVIWRVTVEG